MKKTLLSLLCILFISHSAFSEYANHINLAEKTRILSQQAAKDVVQIYNNHELENSLESLRTTNNMIETIIHGLEYGNKDLGLSTWDNKEVFAPLMQAKKVWVPISNTLGKIYQSGKVTEKQAQYIANNNMTIMRLMSEVVKRFEIASDLD